MRLHNSSQIGLLLLVACSSTNEPGPMMGAGGGAGQQAMGGTSSAGAGTSGGMAAAGSSSGNATSDGGNMSAGGVSAGGGGTSGAPTSGTASAGSGSSGASGSPAGGSGGGSSYEPIADDKFDEMKLFEGQPPNFKAGAPAETVNGQGSISNVSVPTLRRFAMDASKATGFGYIVFPGGAYTGLDFDTHATRLAERVGPLGIAVFGLKYRVGGGTNDAKRDALLDAKRAVRMVKQNAGRWGVVIDHVGVIGYSAGSHLALNLAGNSDAGNPSASDPIEKQSSRPAFVGSMSTWADYSANSPFTFPTGVPSVYFCHAEDDTLAPIALARTVDMQIKAKGGATLLDFYKTGGHSTCHPGDANMEGHDWPNKFWPWVQGVVQ